MGTGTPGAMAASLRGFYRDGTVVQRRCYAAAVVLALSGAVHAVVLLATGGTWLGPVSLRKAVTFGLSFGLTLATVTALCSLLPLSGRGRRWVLGTFGVASVVEVALISMQAWRGVPSHFNRLTPFDSVVSTVLAAGGAVLVAGGIAMGVASLRANPGVPPGMRLALRAGFGTFLLALVIGAVMIARGVLLYDTVSPAAAFAGAGALKAAHAAPMHGVLVLPALAWLLSFADVGERARVRIVSLGVLGYLVLTLDVVISNLLGVDVFAPAPLTDALGLLGFGALLAAGALAITLVVRTGRGPAAGGISRRTSRAGRV